ncbi:DUF4913 domain-containing protein [Micromonospora andamanensis]|uniref:DUF4913 domain-containing protein n=1 Tax=Micromonospora andamanensis TaxID=1287068 RepID=A0ABQ4I2W2_9ACTN|nr:DUF4913 domain-containing protein [Micromonospora andamanensis]GIJ12210.1 hypothetical protein Van01_54240 [Micromonospora andamanensis]
MTDTTTPATANGSEDFRLMALAAQVAQLTELVREQQQINKERTAEGDTAGHQPAYTTVEEWVRDYLLPTFARPVGEVGMIRWHWCEQWWRHDEAVTRLTALWYGWEHARLEMTGMLGWLRELDHHLPLLCGEDGPFRDCAVGSGLHGVARHQMPTIAPVQTAPSNWWDWWS